MELDEVEEMAEPLRGILEVMLDIFRFDFSASLTVE